MYKLKPCNLSKLECWQRKCVIKTLSAILPILFTSRLLLCHISFSFTLLKYYSVLTDWVKIWTMGCRKFLKSVFPFIMILKNNVGRLAQQDEPSFWFLPFLFRGHSDITLGILAVFINPSSPLVGHFFNNLSPLLMNHLKLAWPLYSLNFLENNRESLKKAKQIIFLGKFNFLSQMRGLSKTELTSSLLKLPQ